MIRLTDEQWERIRDHFPEETIIRSLIESRFSASVKGSFGQRRPRRNLPLDCHTMLRRSGPRGCGRWPWGIMRIGRRHTAMQQHARTRWRHSQKTGGGN